MPNRRLPDFNARLAANGYPHAFRMGIGLNSGPVVAGNVRSKERVGYRAAGDTTNTASRLESMTKDTPHQLFVAESTRVRLDAHGPEFVHVDGLDVRDRQDCMTVWRWRASHRRARFDGR